MSSVGGAVVALVPCELRGPFCARRRPGCLPGNVVTRPLTVRRAELPVLALIRLLIIGADSLYAVGSTEGLLSVVVVLSSLDPP